MNMSVIIFRPNKNVIVRESEEIIIVMTKVQNYAALTLLYL